MSDQIRHIEDRLHRILGSAMLSSEQRRRHLDRLAARPTSPRWLQLRLLRDGAVAAVLVAFIAAVYVMLPLGESPKSETDPATALTEVRGALASPDPGEARYMKIEVTSYPPSEPAQAVMAEVWQRTAQDGTLERAIKGYDPNGELIGRVVDTADDWIVETPGNHSTDRFMVPPELSAAVGVALLGPEDFEMDEFLHRAAEEPNTTVVTEEDYLTLTIESPFGEEEDEGFDEQAGFPVTGLHIEITINTEVNQMVRWRYIAEDEQGERHDVQVIRYSVWEEMDGSDLDEDVFAERTELSEQEIETPLPDRIELSLGMLTISDTEMDDPGAGQVSYTGPGGLAIEIRFSPHIGSVATRSELAHAIEVDEVDGVWHEDMNQPDWPRHAIWEDAQRGYSLDARYVAGSEWDEESLTELILALANH